MGILYKISQIALSSHTTNNPGLFPSVVPGAPSVVRAASSLVRGAPSVMLGAHSAMPGACSAMPGEVNCCGHSD